MRGKGIDRTLSHYVLKESQKENRARKGQRDYWLKNSKI